MLPRVLFVDDDRAMLAASARTFMGTFDLVTVESGAQALELAGDFPPFATIVADMQMPVMNGIELLQEFERLSPHTTRIMLTGQADLGTAMEAVNCGNVFRFLTKPCSHAALEATIQAGVGQYQLVTAERVLLEETLTGSVQTLVDLLSVFDPKAFGRSQEVRDYSLRLAAELGLQAPWDLGLAASLMQIGKLAIPMDLHAKANRGERLSIQETEVFRRIPEAGARMVKHIPRLQSVARIIQYSAKDFNGRGYPSDGVSGLDLPLEARILKVASDFVEMMHLRKAKQVVAAQMKLSEGKYDPDVLEAMEGLLDAAHGTQGEQARDLIKVEDLKTGMVLASDLSSQEGLVLLTAGTRLSGFHLEKLRALRALHGIEEPVLVARS